jgi:hypothetical protein
MVQPLIYFANERLKKMNNLYDAIKEKENQIAIYQAQISGLQAEIEALRVAVRILEGGNAAAPEAPRPVAVQTNGSGSGEKAKRVWP